MKSRTNYRKNKSWFIKRQESLKNDYKEKSRIIYRSALRTGKIKKEPCHVCGEKKVDGHHTDYSKPLMVEWLCKKHHALVHRKYQFN